jgi:AraC family transcriptional regulator, regulatory protein of adaptative response / methylated-DNA-[protein]-cysteine methyltransferase
MKCTDKAPDLLSQQRALIAQLCHFMDAHPSEYCSLAVLAERAQLSPFYLQRLFKKITGVSPKTYQTNLRLRQLKGSLRGSGGRITDSILDAGFGSSSRMYEKTDRQLGMTPQQYRKGGDGVVISYATHQSPLGLLMMGATDRGICFVQFAETKSALVQLLTSEYPHAKCLPMKEPASRHFRAWMQALDAYLAGKKMEMALPLDVQGTTFQLSVWRYLQSIPFGSVQSYSEIAAGIGKPKAARAVASACASNVVGIVIPCHRVIRQSGELGGYRWGIERKRALIDLEADFNSYLSKQMLERHGKRSQ